MKNRSLFLILFALCLGCAALVSGHAHDPRQSSISIGETTSGPFRDGFYFGKLAAQQGSEAHIADVVRRIAALPATVVVAAAVTVGTALLCGLAPALTAARTSLANTLRQSGAVTRAAGARRPSGAWWRAGTVLSTSSMKASSRRRGSPSRQEEKFSALRRWRTSMERPRSHCFPGTCPLTPMNFSAMMNMPFADLAQHLRNRPTFDFCACDRQFWS